MDDALTDFALGFDNLGGIDTGRRQFAGDIDIGLVYGAAGVGLKRQI